MALKSYEQSRAERYVKTAAGALSNLNMFAAIAALTENGLIRVESERAASRIRKIAEEEQQRMLRRYDRAAALAAAKAPTP